MAEIKNESPIKTDLYSPTEESSTKLILTEIWKSFPICHREIVDQITNFLDKKKGLPQSLYIYGASGTGKTQIISKVIKSIANNSVIVDCNECLSTKFVYETILNGIFNHKPSLENKCSPYAKCNNARDFLNVLQTCDPYASYVIMIDAADKLVKMDENIFPLFLRLQELCDLNICCVLVSSQSIYQMIPKDGLVNTIVVYWPQYSKKQILNILLQKFNDYKTMVKSVGLVHNVAIVDSMNINFFENFLNLFLSITFQSCRDLKELIRMSKDCFQKYCEPILNGICDMDDVQKLYRNISDELKTSMINNYNFIDLDTNKVTCDIIATKIPNFELPFYAKYLLIAAYLASHNESRLDKRLFMKNHGKQRKRLQDIKSKAVVSAKLTTQLGPKTFNFDRLYAIFYAIIDDKISLNCNLVSQVSNLVRVKLLTFVSGENSVMDGNARLRCTVGLEYITKIGKSVGFNVPKYLSDFL